MLHVPGGGGFVIVFRKLHEVDEGAAFCIIVVRYIEDCKCSVFLKWHCSKNSKLCGMTLAPKTELKAMQSVWTTHHARADATYGYSFAWRNAPEASSSKSKISLFGNDICVLQI